MAETRVIGIDHHGREHVIDLERDWVVVLDNSGIHFQTGLANSPIVTIRDWRQHVESQLGPWRETAESRAMDAVGGVLMS